MVMINPLNYRDFPADTRLSTLVFHSHATSRVQAMGELTVDFYWQSYYSSRHEATCD
jgi:hypothetical protein